ncbi:anti-sigma-28 factor, FlgM family [Vreelandella subglaciescola]|jgi:negative regulator of flagellin synthesis FlgM|uniref:Negative regulator of flagellin synthesis n=1 Tax=Vreelandella subglaciescola TaxID=29571 RepID=A0A1M7HFB8_9GAMM|nr:anti-sigma-28 factor, FlgM family [Halomonas subglaciescola]
MLTEAHSVKINHLNSLVGPNQAHPRSEPQKAQADKAAGAQPAQSDVSHIRQQNVDAGQDIDTLKVEEIRSAIRDGQLEIHADRIAEGLIANLGKQ